MIVHSYRGSQCVLIRKTKRLARVGVATSVGNRGGGYDNVRAETIIGLYKTEVFRHLGSWPGATEVDVATLELVRWFSHRRLLEPIGSISPAEFEPMHRRQQGQAGPRLEPTGLRKTRGASMRAGAELCVVLNDVRIAAA